MIIYENSNRTLVNIVFSVDECNINKPQDAIMAAK